MALTSELLPVPRAPVIRTLFAGLFCRNCRVLRSMMSFWRSMWCRSDRSMRATWRTASSQPRAPRLRHRYAWADQSISGGAAGSQASSWASTRSARWMSTEKSVAVTSVSGAWSSGTVVGIDADIVVREVAGVHGFGGLPAPQGDAHLDLGLLHDTLAVGFLVVGIAAAVARHQHVVEPQAQPG